MISILLLEVNKFLKIINTMNPVTMCIDNEIKYKCEHDPNPTPYSSFFKANHMGFFVENAEMPA